MAYGETIYTDLVKSSCDPQAFKEIEASNERHQKMNNLLLCELVKQIKMLNENIFDMLDGEEIVELKKTVVIETSQGDIKLVEDKSMPADEFKLVAEVKEIKEQEPVEIPKSVVEKYGIKPEPPKAPFNQSVTPPTPLVDTSIPLSAKKAAFGRIPRHEPSKVSENVVEG